MTPYLSTVSWRIEETSIRPERRSLQQIAGQTERHRRRRLDDGVTRLDHVHVEDGLARDFLQRRFRAECGDEPGERAVSNGRVFGMEARQDGYQTVATPYLRDVRTTRAR